jgi:hypothetical protein
LYWRMLL